MKTLFKGALVGAALAFVAGTATATTVSGVIVEGGPSGVYTTQTIDHTFGDFSNGTNTPDLTVIGDFTLFGSVKHKNQNQNKYLDGWSMDFTGGQYDLAFAWENMLSSPLDFELRISADGGSSSTGLTALTLADVGTGSDSLAALGTLTGKWIFQLDPIAGQQAPNEVMNWELAGTVSAVPVPASAFLLVAGLGGLAGLRRRKAAA